MNRLKTLYGWDPAFRMTRQGKLDDFAVKVPQTNGIPGWLCLTRDESSLPVAYWVQRNGNAQIFRMVCDERCFEDTILRAEYTPTHLYLADVWMWNGTPCKKTFSERHAILKAAFESSYTPCPAFETRKVDLRENARASDIRGHEYYADIPGEKGVFMETKPAELYEIVATDIPDVYRVADVGYLRVRTMALSKQLRALGRVFTLECVQNEDGTWTPRIESPSNTNGP
jgi:hypothetical protein